MKGFAPYFPYGNPWGDTQAKSNVSTTVYNSSGNNYKFSNVTKTAEEVELEKKHFIVVASTEAKSAIVPNSGNTSLTLSKMKSTSYDTNKAYSGLKFYSYGDDWTGNYEIKNPMSYNAKVTYQHAMLFAPLGSGLSSTDGITTIPRVNKL